MSDHLPECRKSWRGGECCGATATYEFGGHCNNCPDFQDCICPALRDCEARVLEGRPDPGISEKQAIANHAIYRNGYAAGLAAARDAVAALPHDLTCFRKTVIGCTCTRGGALATIDALKEKP